MSATKQTHSNDGPDRPMISYSANAHASIPLPDEYKDKCTITHIKNK